MSYMDSCEGFKILRLVQHFKSKIFGKISETDFSYCFALCNINILGISNFKEILVSDTLDSCFMDISTHVIVIEIIITAHDAVNCAILRCSSYKMKPEGALIYRVMIHMLSIINPVYNHSC